jgi:hypothetical protein
MVALTADRADCVVRDYLYVEPLVDDGFGDVSDHNAKAGPIKSSTMLSVWSPRETN